MSIDHPNYVSPPQPFPVPLQPLSQVTPFTYRDGYTFLNVLEALRKRLNELLDGYGVQNQAIEDFRNHLNDFLADVLSKLVGYTIDVDEYTYRASMMDGSAFESYTLEGIDHLVSQLQATLSAETAQHINDLSVDVNQQINDLSVDVNQQIDAASADTDQKISTLTDSVNAQISDVSQNVNQFSAQIPSLVSDALADDNTPAQAAAAAVASLTDAQLIDERAPAAMARGDLPEGTDINTYSQRQHAGSYRVRASTTVNGPPGLTDDNAAVLHVIPGFSGNATAQFWISSHTGFWWRELINESAGYGEWRQLAQRDETMPLSRGAINEPTDIDTFRDLQHVGAYVIRAENIIGGPTLEGGNPLATLEILRGAANGIIQRITTNRESWWRGATSNTEWGEWHRQMTGDDDYSGGSGIDYDSDGVPYIASAGDPSPSSRLVTEQSFDNLSSNHVKSDVVQRIIVSNDPDHPTVAGDLLLIFESEQ